jgi:hypothetical protein
MAIGYSPAARRKAPAPMQSGHRRRRVWRRENLAPTDPLAILVGWSLAAFAAAAVNLRRRDLV